MACERSDVLCRESCRFRFLDILDSCFMCLYAFYGFFFSWLIPCLRCLYVFVVSCFDMINEQNSPVHLYRRLQAGDK